MRVLTLLGLLGIACASAPPPSRPAVPKTVDLPRSSIAAVLLHRDELGLTPAQVDTLSRRDDALAKEDEALRARLTTGSSSGAGSPAAAPGRGGRHSGRRPQPQAHAPDVLTQLDDDDTRAYLEVEEQVLTEAQRPRARQIASEYREALYDQQAPVLRTQPRRTRQMTAGATSLLSGSRT
ncbi:MAG: hypothetical protein EHM78_25775 [Myxococcaceae bacterium]|nr:MAG: hypothetical protein EHM78_25775 [Myxococcaceae bacterium]